MGGGSWSDRVYDDRVSHRVATSTPTFKYDADVKAGRAPDECHPTLDLKVKKIREARDSDEHPNSVPIAVFHDTTGSMAGNPPLMQEKLPKLLGLLLRKGYCVDPQVLIGAINDHTTRAKAPLQVGEFESDIRIEDALVNMRLEGDGGGQQHESYELAMWAALRHFKTDAWEKRGKKGYLFLIGDEMPWDRLDASTADRIFGDTLQEPVSTAEIMKQLLERWEVFYLLPANTSYFDDPGIKRCWEKLLGNAERFIKVDDPANICEVIGALIGAIEGRANVDDLAKDLVDGGVDASVAKSVAKSVDPFTKALVKQATSNLPETTSASSAVERL